MNKVYILEHSYEVNECDEIKFIGAFSSKEKAENVISILKDKKGFKDHSIECFYISEVVIDRYGWEEGFISWDEASNNVSD